MQHGNSFVLLVCLILSKQKWKAVCSKGKSSLLVFVYMLCRCFKRACCWRWRISLLKPTQEYIVVHTPKPPYNIIFHILLVGKFNLSILNGFLSTLCLWKSFRDSPVQWSCYNEVISMAKLMLGSMSGTMLYKNLCYNSACYSEFVAPKSVGTVQFQYIL